MEDPKKECINFGDDGYENIMRLKRWLKRTQHMALRTIFLIRCRVCIYFPFMDH